MPKSGIRQEETTAETHLSSLDGVDQEIAWLLQRRRRGTFHDVAVVDASAILVVEIVGDVVVDVVDMDGAAPHALAGRQVLWTCVWVKPRSSVNEHACEQRR